MKRFMQERQEASSDSEADPKLHQVESSEDSSDSDGDGRRLGDKLFDEEKDDKIQNLRDLAKDMDPELLQGLIEKENPELMPMLLEL